MQGSTGRPFGFLGLRQSCACRHKCDTLANLLYANVHTYRELIDEMTYSLTEHVAQYLQVAIINGLLRPGELITEPEIAERLGVSRTPVREAMARLQAIGLIERTPGKYGTRVRAMSSAEAVQILQVRLILESAALEIACVTGGGLRPLRALLEIERQRIDAGELAAQGGRVALSRETHRSHRQQDAAGTYTK